MPVPSSGPISFTVIAENLDPVPPTPYSLRSMSSAAGFETPDSVSEFYGYGPGGGLTLFFRSAQESGDPAGTCFTQCDIPQYHNGTGTLPTVGDIVYNDSGGTDPLQSGGNYWGMNEIEGGAGVYTFYTFKRSGQVVEVYICSPE
jgi:hypothetical protein